MAARTCAATLKIGDKRIYILCIVILQGATRILAARVVYNDAWRRIGTLIKVI